MRNYASCNSLKVHLDCSEAQFFIPLNVALFEQKDLHKIRDPTIRALNSKRFEIVMLEFVAGIYQADSAAIKVLFGAKRIKMVADRHICDTIDCVEMCSRVSADNHEAADSGVDRDVDFDGIAVQITIVFGETDCFFVVLPAFTLVALDFVHDIVFSSFPA